MIDRGSEPEPATIGRRDGQDHSTRQYWPGILAGKGSLRPISPPATEAGGQARVRRTPRRSTQVRAKSTGTKEMPIRTSRFAESKIVGILKQGETASRLAKFCGTSLLLVAGEVRRRVLTAGCAAQWRGLL